jgi:hypothetical protein
MLGQRTVLQGRAPDMRSASRRENAGQSVNAIAKTKRGNVTRYTYEYACTYGKRLLYEVSGSVTFTGCT